ncbi:MAG: HEAT repeat domain-containing protein [Candidatus Methanoculleus thermohydrogenotrophicum]|nr:HEAT repeat domain-containing protein [Candidatus Methanoculleus thermohydrogenotrophicum]
MATLDEIETMRDNQDVGGLIRALADPKANEPLDRMRNEDPGPSAREAAATAYRWVVGRLEEVKAGRRT